MRVVEATRFGGPEVLVPTELPDPVAGRGQVVVEVAFAALDFVQTQLRQGFSPGPPLPEPPYIPGGSVSGVVRSIGPGVHESWSGARVVAQTSTHLGSNAEQVLAATDTLIPVPTELGLAEAAALMDDGSTALGLVDVAPPRSDEWVLVEAAAGGVGGLLVQLAKAAGAHVIGAARGNSKLAAIRELGAEGAVDYTNPDWTTHVRDITGQQGISLVFDGVGGSIGADAFDLPAPGGRFSAHGAASGVATEIEPALARQRQVTVFGLDQLAGLQDGRRERTERAFSAAVAETLTPRIGRTFTLEKAADAHAAVEARAVLGKTLLSTS